MLKNIGNVTYVWLPATSYLHAVFPSFSSTPTRSIFFLFLSFLFCFFFMFFFKAILFIFVVISLHRKSSHSLQRINEISFSKLSSDMLFIFSLFLTLVLLEDLHIESILE